MFSSNAGIPSVECFYPSIVQTLVSEIDFTTAASSHYNKPKEKLLTCIGILNNSLASAD
jgi:hypothetical protein